VPIDDAKEYSPRREISAATGDVINLQREKIPAGCGVVPAIVIILGRTSSLRRPSCAPCAAIGAPPLRS
jgi:hypothetical protein